MTDWPDFQPIFKNALDVLKDDAEMQGSDGVGLTNLRVAREPISSDFRIQKQF